MPRERGSGGEGNLLSDNGKLRLSKLEKLLSHRITLILKSTALPPTLLVKEGSKFLPLPGVGLGGVKN